MFSMLFPRKVRRALRQEGADALAVVVAAPGQALIVALEIELLVENDVRLIPGTILISEESPERIMVTARTYEFGDLEVTL